MKKRFYIIAIAMVAFCSQAFAEGVVKDAWKNAKFEVTVGVNAANINYNNISSRTGFHAGVRGAFDFLKWSADDALYGSAAALISLKGGSTEAENEKVTYNPYYLEIPLHVGYSHIMSEKVKFFFELGPYVAVGLFGKSNGYSVFNDLKFRRFDMGVGFRRALTCSSAILWLWASTMALFTPRRALATTSTSTSALATSSKRHIYY